MHDEQRGAGFWACPACAADPDRGASLLIALPIMTTCGEHGLRLDSEMTVRLAALERDPAPSGRSPGPWPPRTGLSGRESAPGPPPSSQKFGTSQDVPARAGLTVWKPYERLDPTRQRTRLEAVATALAVAKVGAITACGALGVLPTSELTATTTKAIAGLGAEASPSRARPNDRPRVHRPGHGQAAHSEVHRRQPQHR